MPDYASIWNSILTEPDLADVIASVSEDALNDYLAAHRKLDSNYYDKFDSLKDPATGASFFDYEIIVGGDKSAQQNGTAAPLQISLFDTYGKAPRHTAQRHQIVYEYPPDNALTPVKPAPPKGGQKASPIKANIALTATNVNFYLSWPSSTGGTPWAEQVSGVNFELLARLTFTQEDVTNSTPTLALEIVPISLTINTTGLASLRRAVERRPQERAGAVAASDEIRDLVIALISYFATTVGPSLVKSIPLPVLHIDKFDLLPRWLAIARKTLTVGASLDPQEAVNDAQEEIREFTRRYSACVQEDIAVAGGVENLVLTVRSRRMIAAAKRAGLPVRGPLEFLTRREIMGNFKSTSRFLREHADHCKARVANQLRQQIPSGRRGRAAVSQGIAAAVDQFLLQTIVSQFGNTVRQAYTDWLSIFHVIRGRLGYRVAIGSPSIDINKQGDLTGSVPIDAFAGLYYQTAEISKCKVVWGSTHTLGLGITGTPEFTLASRKTSGGVSLLPSFDLSHVYLYTGYGFPIDDILKLLSKPLMDGIAGILDVLGVLLSFYVIPAQIKVGSQNTSVKLSNFTTSNYVNSHAAKSERNNYLMVVADSQGVKAS
jgi:hypothetical protein